MPFSDCSAAPRYLHSFPTRRSSDLFRLYYQLVAGLQAHYGQQLGIGRTLDAATVGSGWNIEMSAVRELALPAARMARLHGLNLATWRSEEHTSELQSPDHLVCRFLIAQPPPDIYTLSLHDVLPICFASTTSSSLGSRRTTASSWGLGGRSTRRRWDRAGTSR